MVTKYLSATTALGIALTAKRGDRSCRYIARSLQIDPAVYGRIENGQRGPAPATARILAKWLDWTLEQVFEAAETPAPSSAPDGSAS